MLLLCEFSRVVSEVFCTLVNLDFPTLRYQVKCAGGLAITAHGNDVLSDSMIGALGRLSSSISVGLISVFRRIVLLWVIDASCDRWTVLHM